MRIAKIGRKLSEEHKRKISESERGKNHYNWKGGKSTERNLLMGRREYKRWRTEVFKRDNYTCQECGKRGVELNAHHIKSWAYFPEFRFDVRNGRTLCLACHEKTDTYKQKGKRIKTKKLEIANAKKETDGATTGETASNGTQGT